MIFKEFRHAVGRLPQTRFTQSLYISKLFHGTPDFLLTGQLPKSTIDLEGNNQLPVAMCNFRQNRRLGNQLFQYTFSRLVAGRRFAQLQLPVWVGSALFGLSPSHQGLKQK